MISPSRAKFPDLAGPGRGGFTLVELLVAMTVAVLLVVMLTVVLSRSMVLSQRSSAQTTAFGAAAAAIDLIATDLSSLTVTRQPYEYLQARPEDASSMTQSQLATFGATPPMRLMFTTTSPVDAAQSSPAPASPSPAPSPYFPDSGQAHAVSYRLYYQNPITATNTGNSIFGLYRQVAAAADTFNYVLGLGDLYAAIYVSPGGNIASSMPATPLPSSFVAANVVDLQVAIYASPISTGSAGSPPAGALVQPPAIINPVNGATSSQPYQRTQVWGTQIAVNNSQSPPATPSPLLGYGPAAYAEVSLTVLEDSGAKLWGNGSGTGAVSPASLRAKYGHTITRKVLLRAAN